MGSAVSRPTSERQVTNTVSSERETMTDSSDFQVSENECDEEFHDTIDEDQARVKAKEEEMEQFKKQLQIKREQRREILDRHKNEKEELLKTLERERKAKLEMIDNNTLLRELLVKNKIEIPEQLQPKRETTEISETITQMKEEFSKLKDSNNRLRRNLAESNNALQRAYSDIAELNAQHTDSIKQINALKEVVTCSKTMMKLREEQLEELKNKLREIERSLADREASMLSSDLRKEYERQLQNIRTLRGLYEERARLAEVTRQGLIRELDEQKRLKQAEIEKCNSLTTKVADLEEKIEELLVNIEDKNSQIALYQDEIQGLQAEMSVVNKLFSQVLLGYKTNQDLDKLVHRLEENHGLLTHMAEKENGSEASTALPKLLLELVTQIEELDENKEVVDNSSANEPNSDIKGNQAATTISAEEIVQYLPKVWRVLLELLSHQNSPEENVTEKVTTCYKSVETQNGPVLVPSVSQTYIRLKDLIIEKLSLIKEVNRMKQLNAHLETRLEEQERKLSVVTTELSKTWHVVGRLRRHHHQLHTHEKILKYELQQKRKLLNELKEELEYCREKWEQAREKNSQTERDLKKLRTEFSNRKKTNSATFNTSAESGYSDERPSDDSSESNDESEYAAERLVRTKKKFKKSFETVLDSSTDFNLAAEREDPASDMLDVADLPLDTQDSEDSNKHCAIDVSTCESLPKNDKTCDETEDEALDIAHDSSVEKDAITAVEHRLTENTELSNQTHESDDATHTHNTDRTSERSGTESINATAILESIRLQNERLAQRDKKLEKLEKCSSTLLAKARNTANISSQIDSTLDHLLNRPTTNRDDSLEPSTSTKYNEKLNLEDKNDLSSIDSNKHIENIIKTITNQNEELPLDKSSYVPDTVCDDNELKNVKREIQEETFSHSLNDSKPSTSKSMDELKEIDFNKILENVRKQDERLAKKDEKFKHLESDCSNIVKNISNTISLGENMLKKLDNLHEKHQESIDETSNQKENESTSEDDSQPSTSSEIDHEARFAARDLRLKMLEEQTKSLVNKVNKTTSKGIKIHYKLEELHNIYGSEGSRGGTPDDEDSKASENNSED